MSDDGLLRFIGAYRSENPSTALDSSAIRRRLLARVTARERRKLAVLRFALPVAAAFLGSVALAATHGVPRFENVREWFGSPASPVPLATAEHRAPAASQARAETPELTIPSALPELPPAVREAVPVEPERPAVAEARPRRAAPARVEARRGLPPSEVRQESSPSDARRAHVPKAEAPHAADTAASDARRRALSADLSDYQRAHSLHFHGGDPAVALSAWNTYLAEHPSGTFAPEARFNRAVCLLRLGRRSEAKGILVPIAGSAFGYGRDRARAILTAME